MKAGVWITRAALFAVGLILAYWAIEEDKVTTVVFWAIMGVAGLLAFGMVGVPTLAGILRKLKRPAEMKPTIGPGRTPPLSDPGRRIR